MDLTIDEEVRIRKVAEAAEIHGSRYLPHAILTNQRYPEMMQDALFADTPLP
jgi:hypothetical protein